MIQKEVETRRPNGQFAVGNPGGPGRPRRAVETEYLATLNEAVSLDDWREVVLRAVQDAKAGDAQARMWLAKYLVDGIGDPLFRLAVSEHRGKNVESEIQRAAKCDDAREADEVERMRRYR